VVLQLLQLFGELLLFIFFWHNELIHHEAATLGPSGHLLEKAAQDVLRLAGEAKYFHVGEPVLLVEEVLQLHLEQAGLLDILMSDNNKEEIFCWILFRPHDCLLPHLECLPGRPGTDEEHKLQHCQHDLGLLVRPEDDALEVSLASWLVFVLADHLLMDVPGDGAVGADALLENHKDKNLQQGHILGVVWGACNSNLLQVILDC